LFTNEKRARHKPATAPLDHPEQLVAMGAAAPGRPPERSVHVKRLTLLSAALLLAAIAVPASAVAKTTVTMSGSTSVAPLAIKLAKTYLKSHKKVKFKLAQGGSDIGVADAAAGRVSIGNSSRDPKPTDPGGLTFNKIARDAVCIVTHPSNRVSGLSQEAVVGIFSGQIRDWADVPGSTTTGPIDLVVRNAASGTKDAFQKLFMSKTEVSSSAQAKASNGLVQQAVKSDPHAIGYVSLAFVPGLNDANYQGVACNLQNAKSGQYPAVRNFYMVTRGAPTGAAKSFIDWIIGNPKARQIVATDWVPLS
jgi:phosphate transport system substrate-binding protein